MRILPAIFLSLCAGSASALTLTTGGVGTSGADFLNVGVGARALAMGGAFAAVDTLADVNAVNWNPGALGFIDKSNASASYGSLFPDQNQGFLGYASKLSDKGVVAASIDYLVVSNIERRAGDTENPDSTFANQNIALAVSYGRPFGDSVSIGGNLKYVRVSLDSEKANAIAADFGALIRSPIPDLTFGVALRNLGTDVGPDPLPLTLLGGVSYKFFSGKLLIDSDVDWMESERRGYWTLGTEYWIAPNLAARAGYQFGHGVDELQSSLVGLGVGLGLKFDRFTADYAFLPYGDLGNTHRITLGMRFD